MIRTFQHNGSEYTVKDGGGYVRALHTGRVIREPITNKMIRASNVKDARGWIEDAWRSAAIVDILAAKRLWPPHKTQSISAKWARRSTIRRCSAMDTRQLLEERTITIESRSIERGQPPRHLAAVQGGAQRLRRAVKSFAPDLSPAR